MLRDKEARHLVLLMLMETVDFYLVLLFESVSGLTLYSCAQHPG